MLDGIELTTVEKFKLQGMYGMFHVAFRRISTNMLNPSKPFRVARRRSKIRRELYS
jgi:hypothetical protein